MYHYILYLLVFVKTCDGRAASVFADKQLTVPMTNPYIARPDQLPKIYTTGQCIEISFQPLPER